MNRKELENYFGKNYKSDPQLVGLNAEQKSNFTIIVNKAKEKGITSNFAIAGLLGIVSKESTFKSITEGSYRKTSAKRVRSVFGKARTSKYTDTQIESFAKDDNKFFDFVYGYIAKSNGFTTYGNDNPGDGFRYRGRGFNQLTFKNIYKERGSGSGLDLVNKPELIEKPAEAALVLIEYYFAAFKGLSNEVAKLAGITKGQSSLATINSITSIETAVDMFYLATSGSMVMSNYKKILKYKSGSTFNTSGGIDFPNDDLGGYSRARNRAPYFFQILTGNKLPDTLPTSNPPSDTQNSNVISGEQNPIDTIEQNSTNDDNTQDTNIKNNDFNPTGLTQLFPPTIKPNRISLDAQTTNFRQRKDFLTGLGTAPFIYYNGIHIEYKDISYFELYHEGILPAIKITFLDRNGIFKDDGFPVDDTIISIFIFSRSKRLRSINMDFKISNFKDLGLNEFTISGIVDLPQVYLRKFKSYSKKTSFEALQDLAKECEMGFCTNISNSNDRMTWINTGFPNYQFIDNIVKNSYLSDSSFLNCYIDFYYNLCYVDIEKELNRNNELDKMIISDGKNQFTEDPERDEDIAPLILSTDHSVKGTNAFISEYIVTNKSTQVSLNKAYLTKTKFYDVKSKEILIFDVDSITSQGDKTIIMKGKPGDENFFRENVANIWVGKLDKFDDEGNAHSNFNYSLVQNQINIDEISKISIDIKLPVPNFNIFILQKIYLALLKPKPGVNHTSLRYKRLVGNWLTTSMSFIFDGSSFFHKVNLIKRELELDDYEKDNNPITQNKNNVEDFQDNQNELSPNDAPPPAPRPAPIPQSNNDQNVTGDGNSFVGPNWKAFDINDALSKIKQTTFKPSKVFEDSLRNVLNFIKNDTRINDIREAAYVLGTAFAEAGYSLQRWEADYLYKGQGIPYGPEGPPKRALDYYRSTNGKKNYFLLGTDSKGLPYFGRGLIQLTGKANYDTYGKIIGVDLVGNGDLLLIPKNSYDVAIEYMRSKEKRTFEKVLKGDLTSARKSVNGGTKGLNEVNGAYNAWLNIFSDFKSKLGN